MIDILITLNPGILSSLKDELEFRGIFATEIEFPASFNLNDYTPRNETTCVVVSNNCYNSDDHVRGLMDRISVPMVIVDYNNAFVQVPDSVISLGINSSLDEIANAACSLVQEQSLRL